MHLPILAGDIRQAARKTRRFVYSLPGFVFGKYKEALLHHASLFTLPSEHEGFSIAILEALAYGLPTLISSGCHFNELAQAQMGWVHPKGVDGLITHLLSILNQPQQSKQRGIDAQQWVFDHFSWESLNRQYIQVYQALLK